MLDIRIDANHAHADALAATLPISVTVTNTTGSSANAVVVSFDQRSRVREAAGSGWICSTTANGDTSCTLNRVLEADGSATFDANVFFLAAPGRMSVQPGLVWTDGAGQRRFGSNNVSLALYRPFIVTKNDDAGAGTLRDAIEKLNADAVCVASPCGVQFQIPASSSRWQTINVHSPLPAITAADVTIDGESQTAFAGDTNPDGPELELRGTDVQAEGLEFRSGSFAEATGVTIGGFGRNGILVSATAPDTVQFRFVRNYLGTDASGSNAVPNALRGLMITGGYVAGEIRDNVLSGNARSGLFVASQQSPFGTLVPSMFVSGNRVGVQAHSDAALPNGASGMYFGPTVDGAVVEHNLIAFNREFGVAIARGARIVRIRQNEIAHNGLLGIDIGLDGPTTEGRSLDAPAAPAITEATYDPATNMTTITAISADGAIPSDVTNDVDFYVSSSREHGDYAEGEHYLGTAAHARGSRDVALTIAGDLRDRFISAVTLQTFNLDGSLLYTTSEFSRAVAVGTSN